MASFKSALASKAALASVLVATSGSSFAARWSAIDAGLPSTSLGVTSLAIDPATPATLYALTSGGFIFKSTVAGERWRPSNGIVGVSSLAIAPKSSTIYAITRHGVVKSTDGGESWNNASNGLKGDASSSPSTLSIHPRSMPSQRLVFSRARMQGGTGTRSDRTPRQPLRSSTPWSLTL